jgi:hypothetical protein
MAGVKGEAQHSWLKLSTGSDTLKNTVG